MRKIDLLQRRLLYLGGLGRGEDENNQGKCALTQVHILRSRPLGERQIFIKGFNDFFLNLTDCVSMHDPDWQGVHAAALEWHVDVLQRQIESKVWETVSVFLNLANFPSAASSERALFTSKWWEESVKHPTCGLASMFSRSSHSSFRV